MRAQDGNLGVAQLDHAQRSHRVNLLEADLRAGMALHELHHEVVGEGINRPLAQGNLKRLLTRGAAVASPDVLVQLKQRVYVVKEGLAVGGETHAAMVGLKQTHARFVLKMGNRLAQGLARDVEPLGGLVEATDTRDGGKPLHLTDVHRPPSPVQPACLMRSSLVTPSCTPVQG